ncbi:hypothetical protein [Moraxella nonliquefaciens]|nr:hypothetical protein [Moraxella nonliquefaciens]
MSISKILAQKHEVKQQENEARQERTIHRNIFIWLKQLCAN